MGVQRVFSSLTNKILKSSEEYGESLHQKTLKSSQKAHCQESSHKIWAFGPRSLHDFSRPVFFKFFEKILKIQNDLTLFCTTMTHHKHRLGPMWLSFASRGASQVLPPFHSSEWRFPETTR